MADNPRPESPEPPSPKRWNHLVWFAPLVIFCGAVSYFILFARFAVLRDFPWVNLPIVLAGLVLAAIAVWRPFARPAVYRGKFLALLSFTFSTALAGVFNAYVFHFSYQLPPPTALTTDLTAAPDFVLPDHEGRPVQLSEYRGRKVVLTFYRGYW